jgi:hypothetical protein
LPVVCLKSFVVASCVLDCSHVCWSKHTNVQGKHSPLTFVPVWPWRREIPVPDFLEGCNLIPPSWAWLKTAVDGMAPFDIPKEKNEKISPLAGKNCHRLLEW